MQTCRRTGRPYNSRLPPFIRKNIFLTGAMIMWWCAGLVVLEGSKWQVAELLAPCWWWLDVSELRAPHTRCRANRQSADQLIGARAGALRMFTTRAWETCVIPQGGPGVSSCCHCDRKQMISLIVNQLYFEKITSFTIVCPLSNS